MGRTVVLTGATSGIGRATAFDLAARTEHLVLHGPEPDPGDLVSAVRAAGATRVDYLAADYGDLGAVLDLARHIARLAPQIDVLINNAGRPGRSQRETTSDGHEATLQVNYLAPVLLTDTLLDSTRLRRVVNVASGTHFGARLDRDDLELEHGYAGPAAYARSKLALVTYSCWLAARRPGDEVVSMHPGVIATDLLHAMFSVHGASPESAAGNVVDVSARHGDSGAYCDERRRAEPDAAASDAAAQEWLAARTAELLAAVLSS
jgi:NAD(P)-dependent dehydrogenase (short-subunit alcohol dehydrogenase family)